MTINAEMATKMPYSIFAARRPGEERRRRFFFRVWATEARPFLHLRYVNKQEQYSGDLPLWQEFDAKIYRVVIFSNPRGNTVPAVSSLPGRSAR